MSPFAQLPPEVRSVLCACFPRILVRIHRGRTAAVVVRPGAELIPALHRARFVRTSSEAWTWVPTLH